MRWAPTEERFWSRVTKSETCWLWTGPRDGRGYGELRAHGRKVGAHRYSWSLANGRMPTTEEFICHACDVPTCVNPAHLSLGDHKSNMKDMVSKGRGKGPGLRGEHHPMAKLTAEQIVQLRDRRRSGERVMSLAKEFEISIRHAYSIVSEENWQCA